MAEENKEIVIEGETGGEEKEQETSPMEEDGYYVEDKSCQTEQDEVQEVTSYLLLYQFVFF